MELTTVYHTARTRPEFGWFLDSLEPQIQAGDKIRILFVDFHATKRDLSPASYYLGQKVLSGKYPASITGVHIKPTIWQGNHRITKEDWWAASNSRNTGICLCRTDWIAFLDDRCVLMPGWLDTIREAMEGKYAVFGTYQKRTGITVENGVIRHSGIVTGEDSRADYVAKYRNNEAPTPCPGEWAFGCTLALPLEWALKVNGYDETCDGLSMEDCIFGMMLANNGYELKFDRRMSIIEDRTLDALDQKPMKREDKGISPNDKSHAMLAMLKDLKQARHTIDLRKIRQTVLAGGNFPPPVNPVTDWYDGQPISQM